MLNGRLEVVPDVPAAYAALVAKRCATVLADRPTGTFRLGASGGTSGTACARRLAIEPLTWGRITWYFADERCVAPGCREANAVALADALGARRAELAGYFPMDCETGPEPYTAELRRAGGLDCLQLGLGPDGHTASLFPGSAALDAPPGDLVARNVDPTGENAHGRLTLTYAGIATADLVVVTVIGAARADALGRIARGEDLPAARLVAAELVWLVDPAAAAALA